MTTTAELSENSHQGFDGIKAAFCLASMEAKSNTASGMPVCLWRNGIGSRSSGKERDETGLDYFGARYFSGAMGRFTSPDPFNIILHADTGIQTVEYRLQPQNWNRYSYTWNNPLRYIDPTGELVVLTNEKYEDKKAALERLKNMTGCNDLDFDPKTGIVIYTGTGDIIKVLGQFGEMLKDPEKIIEYKIAEEFTYLDKHGKEKTVTTESKGGAGTVGKEGSLTGNIQIFVHPDSARLAKNVGLTWQFYWLRSSDGNELRFDNKVVDAHEYGHAWGQYKHGKKIMDSNETHPWALGWENQQRWLSNDSRININRRKRH